MHHAIILAAGVGSRLRPLTDSKPKCLVKINGKSILQHQIDALRGQKEIGQLSIVTGYRGDMLQSEMGDMNLEFDVNLVHNEEYDTTNNMFSLSLALERMPSNESLLLMNGDVICDDRIIDGILNADKDDLIAVDKDVYLEESMKVCGSSKRLTSISKSISEKDAYGVSIDIYSFSPESCQILENEIASTIKRGELNKWVEVAINDLLLDGRYPAVPYHIKGKQWCEIDTLADIEVAETLFKKETGMEEIASKKAYVFDLDGTLILGGEPIEGAGELVKFLRNRQKEFIVVTNNSSRGIEETRRKVSKLLGINISHENVFSSTHSTIQYIKERGFSKVYPVGTESFISDLLTHGIEVGNSSPDAVVIAFDTELNYQKIRTASLLIRKGIPFIATHADRICPTSEGFIPDAGSILALFTTATGKEPDMILGKPSPEFIHNIAESRKLQTKDIAVIGDRLHTDIKMGLEGGCVTAVVFSGDTCTTDLSKSTYLPDYAFYDVGEILEYLLEFDKN